jgi:hypothetical protein
MQQKQEVGESFTVCPLMMSVEYRLHKSSSEIECSSISISARNAAFLSRGARAVGLAAASV